MTRPEPAGDYDYEGQRGRAYAKRRRTDPRIEDVVHKALGHGRTLINVGAGGGSYEPGDRYVVAVEPSASMRAQRGPDRVPAIDAVAEDLPFDDGVFDAAMAMITIHQWRDLTAGLRELRRVSRGPVVILTFTEDSLSDFWLREYVPKMVTFENSRMPPIEHVASLLGGDVSVEPVPIPFDCVDGFIEAYYGRPEAFLDPAVRAAQSAWASIDEGYVELGMTALRTDLESGEWDKHFGHLRTQQEYFGSMRLVIAR